MLWLVGAAPNGSMTVSISIKNVRDPRSKYLFQVSRPREATETDEQVKRVAIEVAKFLAGRMAEQDQSIKL